MKKILALLFLVAVFCSEKSIGQGFLFSHVYNSTGGIFFGEDETQDGNLILSGEFYSNNNQDGTLLKVDLLGNIIWQKFYSFLYSSKSVKHTPDGGFIFYGQGDSIINGLNNYTNEVFLVKTNSTGDTLWTKKFLGENNVNSIYNLNLTHDSGFIFSYDTTDYPNRIHLTKISTDGNIQWQKIFNGNSGAKSNVVFETFDLGFVIAGKIDNDSSYILKTDSSGIELWDTAFSEPNELFCGLQLPDSTLIFVNDFSIQSQFWKFSKSGTLIDFDIQNISPDNRTAYKISPSIDGGFLVAGHYVDTDRKFYFAKYNSQGQFQWDYKYDTPNQFGDYYNDCFDVIQSAMNGNFYLVGGTQDILDTYYPTLVSINEWATNVSSTSSNNSCKIFSSLDGAVQIQFKQTENYSLDIFDLNGKLISQSAGNNSEVNENFNLPSGVYLIKVSTKDFTASQLFPVVH